MNSNSKATGGKWIVLYTQPCEYTTHKCKLIPNHLTYQTASWLGPITHTAISRLRSVKWMSVHDRHPMPSRIKKNIPTPGHTDACGIGIMDKEHRPWGWIITHRPIPIISSDECIKTLPKEADCILQRQAIQLMMIEM